VDGVDFKFKEFLVTEAVGLSFHGFDFVVGAFEWSRGDGVVVVGEDAPGIGKGDILHFS
jgi:hypothetical protein